MLSGGFSVFGLSHFPNDPMQTKLPEINASELKAVRDFLIGSTDEMRLPAARPTKPSQKVRSAVPVTHGISRDRIRSAKAGV